MHFGDILLDSVNVSWAPPAEPNGKLLGYLVSYETFKIQFEYQKRVQDKVNRSWWLATGLESNITYTFTIKAETAAGYGPPMSGAVVIGPQPGSPEAPKSIAVHPDEESVNLEWVNGAEGAAPITFYLVQYKEVLRPVNSVEELRKKR